VRILLATVFLQMDDAPAREHDTVRGENSHLGGRTGRMPGGDRWDGKDELQPEVHRRNII
jgi:hypothetical protein